MGFVCSVCGEHHDEPLLDIRMGLPEPVFELSEEEREERAEVADDSGIFRSPAAGEHYYVRGLLEIPIPTLDRYFGYGAWIEVDAASYDRLGELWHDERGRDEPPFAGKLANELAPYERTVGLPVMLQLREVELLPTVELVETDHPLRADQRTGISEARAQELAAARVHSPSQRARQRSDPGRAASPVRPEADLDSQSLHEPA